MYDTKIGERLQKGLIIVVFNIGHFHFHPICRSITPPNLIPLSSPLPFCQFKSYINLHLFLLNSYLSTSDNSCRSLVDTDDLKTLYDVLTTPGDEFAFPLSVVNSHVHPRFWVTRQNRYNLNFTNNL